MSYVAAAAALGGAASSIGLGFKKSSLQWSRQKRMMQNRHQWEVRDLKAAGLNPILSAGGAPSMGSPQQSSTPDLTRLGDTANTARQNKALRGQMGTQRALMNAQSEAQGAAARHSNALAGKATAETGWIDTQHAITALGIPAAQLANQIAQSQSGQWAARFNAWAPTVQAGAHILGSLGLLRMGSGSAKNLGQSTRAFSDTIKMKRWTSKGTKAKAQTRTGLNPKFKRNKLP